jgi:tRNA (mo5U34)-methyltransferase
MIAQVMLSDVLGPSADAFTKRLRSAKAEMPEVRWYPYDSIAALPFLRRLTDGTVVSAGSVLDVGAADGDLSFLFAEAGAGVDALENAQTNFNKGEGLRRLNEAFGGAVSLMFADIDFRFDLKRQYDLCLAMGICYHLRNPLLFYTTLAQHCQFMVTNTRIIDIVPSRSGRGLLYCKAEILLRRLGIVRETATDAGDSFAYLLERREINDDSTNYWLFSPAGYRRVLNRSGWRILRETSVGARIGTLDDDRRIWALCERVPNYAELKLHHDF